ncbi:MAG: hypothetical protein PUB21_07675 [Bacteroidales bacterium]|nr:hypothetical protein [Bacteroidales bacterium]
MIQFRNIALLIACAGSLLSGNAQNQGKEQPLQRELLLEREYNPDIMDATKYFSLPELTPPSITKSEIEYANFVIPFQPERALSPLQPGNVNTEIKHSKKRGYIRAAGGNYLNLNGDAGYHILQNEKDKLSLWYSHRSTNGKIEYLDTDIKQKAKINDNTVGIDYAHTFKYNIWKLSAAYGSYAFNYYGRPTDIRDLEIGIFNLDKLQRNQLISFNTGLATKENEAFNYDVNLSYYNFYRKLGAQPDFKGVIENSADIDFDFYGDFNSNKRIGLDGHINAFFYNLPNLPDGYTHVFNGFNNYVDICLNPYFGVEDNDWKLRVGVLAHLDINESEFMIAPDIRFDWLFSQHSKLYINVTGDVRHNSNKDMLWINRYVDPTQRVQHTKDWIISEIGIKSQPVAPFWFDVNLGYDISENDVFFTPGHIGEWANVATPRYMKSRKFHIGAALNYKILNNLSVSAKGKWNAWNVSNDDLKVQLDNVDLKAYGKPSFEAEASLKYQPIPKLFLEANYQLLGGRYTWLNRINEKMKNINELNLKGTYVFNDTFSVFAQVNNLLFQEYELWWGYPMQKFNFQVGFNINF